MNFAHFHRTLRCQCLRRLLTFLSRLANPEFTVMMSFVAEGLVASGDLSKYPATQSWFKGISARPAWKKAEERGGKTDLSLITK